MKYVAFVYGCWPSELSGFMTERNGLLDFPYRAQKFSTPKEAYIKAKERYPLEPVEVLATVEGY